MSGLFGATAGEWLRENRTIYALDERGINNRFSLRIEGGYEIKSPFQARATSSEEIAANARAIAQVPAMLELVTMACSRFTPDNEIMALAKKIAKTLEDAK